MKTIGVIGGGQLARMLALAGYPLGLKVICLEPNAQCPAAEVTEVIRGDYADEMSLQALAARVDVITYEFENIALAALAKISKPMIYPAINALEVAQDRLNEKQFFKKLAIPTTDFIAVDSFAALQTAIKQVGLPAMLKTRRWGYDGKGQAAINTLDELEAAWERLKNQPLLLENKITFQREVSCLAARSAKGETVFYPMIENQHKQGILRVSQAILSKDADAVTEVAHDYVQRILDELNYIGVLAVEFFEQAGRLIANEIAPRVHNSGHWTIEGAQTSQFENHLRAVAGLPLGITSAMGYSAMVNFISTVPQLEAILTIPGVHCHLYGKEPRLGRKLGHATLCVEDASVFSCRFNSLRALSSAC